MCVEITALYDTSRVRTTPAYTEAFEELGAVTPFTRTVCLHKLTHQANAELDFDMCTNNECEHGSTRQRRAVLALLMCKELKRSAGMTRDSRAP